MEHAEGRLLLLCTARPDLLDGHPQWGVGERASRLVLAGLGDAAVSALIDQLLGDTELPDVLRARIQEAAGGNPLYVEQMHAMLQEGDVLHLREDGVGGAVGSGLLVPPTISALIAARLDRLGQGERAVIEPAAVIGLVFADDAAAALAPEAVRPRLQDHLQTLVSKQLVHPQEGDSEADRGHQFHHLLIRDEAYNGLLKRTRASLHEQFVGWADAHNAARQRGLEYQEIARLPPRAGTPISGGARVR